MKKLSKVIRNNILLFSAQYKPLKLLWFPRITNTEDLNREIAKMCWYTNPFKNHVKKIYFFVSKNIFDTYKTFNIPTYADKTISTLYPTFKPKIILIYDAKKLQKTKYDIIVTWKDDLELDTTHIRCYHKINASTNNNQFEANRLAKLSSLFLTKKVLRENTKQLNHILIKFKSKYNHTTLLGTGPSLQHYQKYNYHNSLVIACNSIVKNNALLQRVQPHIIVATDAVFHSGYSAYASEFREKLCDAFDLLPKMIFFAPLRDLNIYYSNLPQKYRNRIIGIEGAKLENYNLDLIQIQKVKSTSNVLTFFLLPLAATLSQKISLLGFDGKNKKDIDKFWSYDQNSQFTSELTSTKLAHPSFYFVNYDDYYTTHCQETAEIVKNLKQKQISLHNLEPSYIPSLEAFND